MNDFYTYAYLREDRTPYYIGKGTGDRLYKKGKKKGIRPPKDKYGFIDKSRIIFLKQNLIEEEAFKHEKYMIAVLGRKDNGTGILRNLTDGGEGVSGYIPSESVREARRRNGKVIGKQNAELKRGVCSLTKEQRVKNGNYAKENGLGVFSLTKEQKKENSRKIGQKNKELGIGICGLSFEERSAYGKIGGAKNRDNKSGICGLSFEERSDWGKKCKEEGIGIFSPEFLKIRSQILSERLSGEGNPMYGKKHNSESIEKMKTKALERSKKIYKLKNPNGEIIIFENIVTFCSKYNLYDGSISQVLGKRNKQHKGWTLPETILENKIYKIKSPEGIIYTFNNITEFSKEHNIKCGLDAVLRGVRKSCYGWTLVDVVKGDHERPVKEFLLKSPTGEIVSGKNVKKFCNENNLGYDGIKLVLNGKQKLHKGWTVP